MRIEFLKQHGPYVPGQVVNHPHPGVADALVRRGIAIPREDEKPPSESAKKLQPRGRR